MSKIEYIMIMTNCRDDREADFVINSLLDAKLAGAVQSNKVHSHYYYNGKLVHDSEIRLLIKTKAELFEACKSLIQDIHSYNLPEIVALPIVSGSEEFLSFLDQACDL